MIYSKIGYFNRNILKFYKIDKPMMYLKVYLDIEYKVNFWNSFKLNKNTLPLKNRTEN